MKTETLPPSIPYEDRRVANLALIELADRMMRGAQSLMSKSVRVMDPDPSMLRRTLSYLRKYGNSGMPCSDEMVKIEALLLGMPEDECLSERDKRQLKREEDQRREKEWRGRFWEEENKRSQRVEKALLDLQNGRPLSVVEEARLKEISEAFYCRKELPVVRVEGSVVEGPWDTAP